MVRALEAALAQERERSETRTTALEAELRERTAERDELRESVAALRTDGEREQQRSVDDVAALRSRCESAEAAYQTAAARCTELEETVAAGGAARDQLSAEVIELQRRLLTASERETRLERDVHETASRCQTVDLDLQRLRSAHAGLQAELAIAQRAIDAQRSAADEAETRRAAAECDAQVVAEQHAHLQQLVLELENRALEEQARLVAMEADLGEERRARASVQAAVDALCEQADQERSSASAWQDRAVAAMAERDALQLRADELAAQCDALQVAPDEAPPGRPAGEPQEDPDARLTSLRQQIEALAGPPAHAVEPDGQDTGHLRGELLARLRAIEQACDTGDDGEAPQSSRAFRRELHPRETNGSQAAADQAPRAAGEHTGLFARGRRRPGYGGPTKRVQSEGSADTGGDEAPSARIVLEPGDELTVVHVEHSPPLRDALRTAVDGCACARYAALHDVAPGSEGSTHLLAVNLLAHDADPLATICDPRWRLSEPSAFVYLAAGKRGVIAGLVDFFPYPLVPDDCVTRLLERPGRMQRLLMVSDKIDAMNEIRTVLNRVDCSTSLALDGRQGLNLAGMVKPDAIFIDLTLPRGESLRLVHRLRSNPDTAAIALIFALAEPLDVDRFRADAGRALGDCSLSDAGLSEAFAQVLGEVRVAEARSASPSAGGNPRAAVG
jgi:CheY-like chemotaxis protein